MIPESELLDIIKELKMTNKETLLFRERLKWFNDDVEAATFIILSERGEPIQDVFE